MEEIAYRPQNVRETLVELKDTSELAVDLAYAATLYRHEGLAEVVLELEARVDALQYPAKIALMLAAKRADDAERLVGIVQIVDAAVTIANAAADVAAIEVDDVGLPEEVRAALPDADEVVMRATIDEASDLLARRLGSLALETETGVRVAAVRRDDEWTISPDDEFAFRSADVVVGIGPADGVAELHERMTGDPQAPPTTPGTDVEALERAAEQVVSLKNVAELAVGLGYAAVLFDDEELAAEVGELERRSDALSDDIERSVIEACEHVAEPETLRGLLHLGTASEAICDAALDVADIVLREGDVHPVFAQAIRESDELITTTAVAPRSDLAGTTLGAVELEERTGMAIMAIHRENDWFLAPDGETRLVAGDALIARGPADGASELRSWASGR